MAAAIRGLVKAHPGLVVAVSALATFGLSVAVSYVLYVRAIGEPWVPFPISLVLTEECADVFLLKLDLLHKDCLKKTVSKGLGYAIVVASAGLKLPVIANVVRARSAMGMSTSSVALESVALVCGFTAAIKKGNPFSLWGELLLIFLQNMVLMGLARSFSEGRDPSIVVLLGVFAFVGAALAGPIPADLLLSLSIVITFASRVPQIVANFQQKHTGVLSIITQTLQVLGNLARLGTVAVETNDPVTLLSYVFALALNGILLGQVIMYWSNTKAEMNKKTAKKEE